MIDEIEFETLRLLLPFRELLKGRPGRPELPEDVQRLLWQIYYRGPAGIEATLAPRLPRIWCIAEADTRAHLRDEALRTFLQGLVVEPRHPSFPDAPANILPRPERLTLRLPVKTESHALTALHIADKAAYAYETIIARGPSTPWQRYACAMCRTYYQALSVYGELVVHTRTASAIYVAVGESPHALELLDLWTDVSLPSVPAGGDDARGG